MTERNLDETQNPLRPPHSLVETHTTINGLFPQNAGPISIGVAASILVELPESFSVLGSIHLYEEDEIYMAEAMNHDHMAHKIQKIARISPSFNPEVEEVELSRFDD